jgi:CO dehydrogenase maturation factor
MKIAITGKGGVGKSTFSALLARILRDNGKKVLAIDADPDMNLAGILGIPDEVKLIPISQLKELIAERTGTEVGKSSPLFKMNPQVNDIPDQYSYNHKGIKLLVMGTISRGGSGCACPANAFLKTLLSHLLLSRDEWVIMDMEAGIEHLGRGTAMGVDQMIVVVEPGRSSVHTALRIKDLSQDIGVKKIEIVGNKIEQPGDKEFIEKNLVGFKIIGYLSYSEQIKGINLGQATALNVQGDLIKEVENIIKSNGWL